ncbi:hypothetical protein Tco_0270862 [Tanacetum coccineum]
MMLIMMMMMKTLQAGPNQGSKTDKSATENELIKEPIDEVEMDDPVNTTAEDVAPDADQPHDDSTQANDKAPKQD